MVGAKAEGVLELGGGLVESVIAEAHKEREHADESFIAHKRGDTHRSDDGEDDEQEDEQLTQRKRKCDVAHFARLHRRGRAI